MEAYGGRCPVFSWKGTVMPGDLLDNFRPVSGYEHELAIVQRQLVHVHVTVLDSI